MSKLVISFGKASHDQLINEVKSLITLIDVKVQTLSSIAVSMEEYESSLNKNLLSMANLVKQYETAIDNIKGL